MTRLLTISLLTASLLAGCNTIAGIGEDISGAARSVQGGMPGSYQ